MAVTGVIVFMIVVVIRVLFFRLFLFGGLEKLFKLALAAFHVDFVAVVFGGARGGTVRKMHNARLRIFDNRRLFKRKMRRAAAFVGAGTAMARKTHNIRISK